MVPIISIVGASNSGKTTIIEIIIKSLKEKNYKVGAIKHDAHKFDIDHPGKDSWRMTAAGADTVVISSEKRIAMVKVLGVEKNLDELSEWMFKDMDIVITEGYKAGNKLKIEVVRFNNPLTFPGDNLIAIIDNRPEDSLFILGEEYDGVVKLDFDKPEKIVEFVEDRLLKKQAY